MRRVVFVDLDDTLFQTARKDPNAHTVAAVDGEGRPLSFQSDRQSAVLDWLADGATVIPVTGRSVQAFRRVVLPLGEWAICSFGGVILDPDGAPNPAWHQRMTPAAAATASTLETLHDTVRILAADLGIDVRYRIIQDAGLPLYLSVKHNANNDPETARLAEALAPRLSAGWTVHRNSANMALLPPFLGKAHAVTFLLDELRASGADARPLLTIGVGDSLTDLGYMALCDYAVIPQRAQIADLFAPWVRPALSSGAEDAA